MCKKLLKSVTGGLFGGSEKMGPSAEQLRQMRDAEEQRAILVRQQQEQNQHQADFQAQQQRYQKENSSVTVPKPAPAPETSKQAAPVIPSDSSEAKKLKNKKIGRASLRIPLSTTTAAAGGTGLNIPTG